MAFTAGTRPANGLIETSGPTTLLMGAVAEGELLSRSGTTLVGTAGGGGGGGAWTALTQVIADNDAAVVFDSNIDATFKSYVILIEELVQQTDDRELHCELLAASVSKGSGLILSATAFGSDTGENSNGEVWLTGAANTGVTAQVRAVLNFSLISGDAFARLTAVQATDQTAIDEIVFSMESGNIVSGVFTLFGVSTVI